MTSHSLLSGMDPDLRTPHDLYRALDREHHFSIDAAADSGSSLAPFYFGPLSSERDVGATQLLEDGLSRSWVDVVNERFSYRPVIFVHPPCCRRSKQRESMPVEPWLAKASEASMGGLTVVALVPRVPEASWWRVWVEGLDGEGEWVGHAADQVRLIHHPIQFLLPDGALGGESRMNYAVVIWRPNPGWVSGWAPAHRDWDYV